MFLRQSTCYIVRNWASQTLHWFRMSLLLSTTFAKLRYLSYNFNFIFISSITKLNWIQYKCSCKQVFTTWAEMIAVIDLLQQSLLNNKSKITIIQGMIAIDWKLSWFLHSGEQLSWWKNYLLRLFLLIFVKSVLKTPLSNVNASKSSSWVQAGFEGHVWNNVGKIAYYGL